MNKSDKKVDNEEILYLRKRLIFQEIRFKSIFGFMLFYPMVVGSIILLVEFKFGAGTFNQKCTDISIGIGKCIIAFLLFSAIIDNIKHNRLIKKGKVIIAEIDKASIGINLLLFFFAQKNVKCSYHDYENGKLWEFKGVYTEFCPAHRWLPDMSALSDEWQIPVLVDEKDYKKYFVLTRELVHSYDRSKWDRVPYFARVIRKVDLTQIEKGTKFSNRVKFR